MRASLSVRLRRAPTRYVPSIRIACGGMAEVWRAEAIFEDGDSHDVAIKRVLPQMNQPMFRSMFEDEARLGMKLRHGNIVRVYDARDIRGTYIMVMELVDGDSLKSLLDGARQHRACMPVPTALHILRELMHALEYAHSAQDASGDHLGIIHRDVSPHNLLLGRDGSVKLTDFGLADAAVHATARSENLVGGKLGYLAPELIAQQRGDFRLDLFAAGVIAWEMMAGRRLFAGNTDADTVRNVSVCQVPPLVDINPRVPPAVDQFVQGLLQREPQRRPDSAGNCAAHIDALIGSIDPRVGPKDVSLLTGLHLAAKRKRQKSAETLGVAAMLAEELDAFVKMTGDASYDLGATPLDPSDFDLGSRC